MKKIVIVAGDKSADIYGGLLCEKIQEKFDGVEIFSFGGNNLAKSSHQVINLLDHSVSGLVEVISSIKKLFDIFKRMIEEINRIKPDLIILMDFPDFNLKLAKTLNKKYPLFYYISPQLWAWRKSRINLIKKYVDKMVVIFKFEEDFYKKENVDALYFGHPLLEMIKNKETEPKKIISFLPGSRKNEIKKHLPVMLETKKILEKELKDFSFRIIRPDNIEEDFYKKLSPKIEITPHSYDRIKESAFIITCSGTATVEISILEVPFLIIYKMNPLSWHILRRIVDTKFIGMVNILSGKKVIEELIQEKANPKNIAKITLEALKHTEKYQKIKEELKQVKSTMSPYGATDKFADFIGQYLNLK
ncbi:MAG: lipid-A-disaccharide synthase [Candidatus Omnitrophota bacterium]|nr:lipid-A-disaccharide synthase [Candidatus Omnitrophota bacterium]